MEKKTGHGLNRDIVYGPVFSRRYGMALGINILPSFLKKCSFDCVYCQLGSNAYYDSASSADFPGVNQIYDELRSFFCFQKKMEDNFLEAIVLSGNGEPTLHPQFSEVIEAILEIKKNFASYLPLVCLTNGAHLHEKKIFHALELVDECAVKLDANVPDINMPVGDFKKSFLLDLIFQMKNVVIQSCFVDGIVSNTDKKSVAEWVESVKKINPQRLDLYTVDRRTAMKSLLPVSSEILHSIASQMRKQVSFLIRVV